MKKIIEKLKAVRAKLVSYWASERSTLHGYYVVALGLVTGVNAEALHTLGLAEDLVHKIAAALVLGGALLITPKGHDLSS